MGNLPDSLLKEFLLLGGVVIVLVILALVVLRLYKGSATKSSDVPPGLSVQSLKELEKRQLLTPEEMKRVREAMARQFLETQREREEAEAARAAGSGIEMLEQEARLLEVRKKQEAAPPGMPPIPPPDHPDAHKPNPVLQIVPRLQALADRSRADLEDLVRAGFITSEDMEVILTARGEQP